MSDSPFRALPVLLAEMAELIADATGDQQLALRSVFAIMRAKGGQRVAINDGLEGNDWLVQAVGREIASILISVYASTERYDIPMGPTGSYNGQASVRREIIAAGLATGLSVNEIAEQARVTRRMVFWMKARLTRDEKDKRQLSFFDDAAA